MMKKIAFASIAALASATAAQAQIKAEHPRFCVMNVGPTQMMFSAFQENKTDEIFCQHVADIGKTTIILDARSNELRDMNIEVRVIKNIGQKDWRDDLDATTLSVTPAKKYLEARSTASFNFDFGKEGDYIALVRATSDDGAKEYIGEYFFSVGETYEQAMASGAVGTALAFAGLLMWRRSQSAKPANSASQGKPANSAARQSS